MYDAGARVMRFGNAWWWYFVCPVCSRVSGDTVVRNDPDESLGAQGGQDAICFTPATNPTTPYTRITLVKHTVSVGLSFVLQLWRKLALPTFIAHLRRTDRFVNVVAKVNQLGFIPCLRDVSIATSRFVIQCLCPPPPVGAYCIIMPNFLLFFTKQNYKQTKVELLNKIMNIASIMNIAEKLIDFGYFESYPVLRVWTTKAPRVQRKTDDW